MSLIGRSLPAKGVDLKSAVVLVTGATGFIGSHLVPRLVECGARVIAVAPDLGWQPWIAAMVDAGKITFVKTNVLTPEGVDLIAPYLPGVDCVIHMARVWAQGDSKLDLAVDETNRNLLGSLRFLACASRAVKKIIYPSSVEVYGVPDQLPLREDHPLRPLSPYSVAKVAAEGFLKASAAGDDVSITVLRYSTIYGPAEIDPRAIPNFIRATLQGLSPVIDGDGNDVRDYVYIADVVDATINAMIADQKSMQTYNIGTGTGCTTNDLARLIIRLAGANLEPAHRPSTRPPTEVICDISKASAGLGYRPAYSLSEGLSIEIQWFRDHPDLWMKQ